MVENAVPPTDIADLWRRFKSSKDQSLRNALLLNYLPTVKYNADRLMAKLPKEVEHDDLMSAGILGLIQSIEAYDPQRGLRFITYCNPRVRGAMLDELRGMDWVPRLTRSRATKLEHTVAQLTSDLGRPPGECDIAERLGLSRASLDELLRNATPVTRTSLSATGTAVQAEKDVDLTDNRARDPLRELQKKDLKALFTRGLSRTERLALILRYYENMTMKEIGLVLELSEARVSQILQRLLPRLKERLEERRAEHGCNKCEDL
jgi:RNA polymerase sigma factor for flagellar operon FliA